MNSDKTETSAIKENWRSCCKPGTKVVLEGVICKGTSNDILVVDVKWRGQNYVGTLLNEEKFSWASFKKAAPTKPDLGDYLVTRSGKFLKKPKDSTTSRKIKRKNLKSPESEKLSVIDDSTAHLPDRRDESPHQLPETSIHLPEAIPFYVPTTPVHKKYYYYEEKEDHNVFFRPFL